MNNSYQVLRKGNKVVDLGCAPGGWLQIAAKEVGERGRVVGIDVKPVEPISGALVLQGSIEDPGVANRAIEILGGTADVVLSDLAPNVSGLWDIDHARQISLTNSALGLARNVLREGGNAIFKVFEGRMLGEIRAELKKDFGKVLISKPNASRQESSEMYIVCLGFKKSQ
jgi:23S rRNA (uridine2552-2'-O)-methyltransferase